MQAAASALIAEKEWDTFRNRWTASRDGRAFSAVDFGEYRSMCGIPTASWTG